jgi:hypothetical protein
MLRYLLPALVATACHYDLDAVDRPGGDGGGTDGAVPDPCEVDQVPATVHLHGVVLDAGDATPVEDVTVDAMPGGNAVSAANGSFAIDVALGGVAQPIAIAFDAPGDAVYPLHRREFQRPFDRADVDIQPRLHSNTTLDSLYGGDPVRDEGAVTVIIWVFDCEDAGVAGAVVTVTPSPDDIVYFGGGDSTDPTGVAYGLNVPAGDITVSATGTEPLTFQAPAGSVVVPQLVAP